MMKSPLHHLGIADNELCLLCGLGAETYEHLFKVCPFTRLLMGRLMAFLKMRLVEVDLLWVHRKPWAKVKKLVVNAFIQACWYATWQQRNTACIECRVSRPQNVINEIVVVLRMRATFCFSHSKKSSDVDWIKILVV
ncbi:hypothetical protein RND81_04G089300 [Saponaria officinalis]|uniref:Reverse transcriptase zinc-binding domain-containing protein n=1 Tax=Saponaria officinalis TaxID=3572 RepID=A0AAW1LDR2_SAPOF